MYCTPSALPDPTTTAMISAAPTTLVAAFTVRANDVYSNPLTAGGAFFFAS